MKSYIDAINTKEIDDYRFLISCNAAPQYGAGIRLVKVNNNFTKQVVVLQTLDGKELTPSSDVKVLEYICEIPTLVYPAISNLINLIDKYTLGLVLDPKDLEKLSSVGNISVFKKI